MTADRRRAASDSRGSGWLPVARVAGVLLVILGAGPLYGLLPEQSIPGGHALRVTRGHLTFIWGGAALISITAVLASWWLDPERFRGLVRRVSAWLSRPPSVLFAGSVALFAAALTLLFGTVQLGGKPPFLDAMAQLLHARYLAEGQLAGPALDRSEFWMFQNLVMTDDGWLSQYPPGHIALLAAGLRLGAVQIVGPLMAGVAVFFTALAAERLLPEDRAVARLGGLLAGLSPFMTFLSATFMNHVTAAAFAALAIYCMTRAWTGHGGWTVAAGAAVGAVFAVRPLAAVVVGVVVALGLVGAGLGEGRVSPTRYARRLLALVAGALPFGVAVGAYNARFFGSPFRFGYSVAQGPSHALGFHPDPWGTMYGLTEAVGYTAADLVALSRFLFHTPLPVVTLIGLYLLVTRRLGIGRRVILGWAVLPVVANLFYWHHDLIMGPRMLADAAPAWALLAAVAAVGLVREVPARITADPDGSRLPGVLATGFVLALVLGLGYLGPRQAARYGGAWQASSRIEPPRTGSPALVFVHESWSNRLGARLASRGLRQDSVMRLLAAVPPCVLQAHLDGLVDPGRSPTEAEQVQIRAACEREARADRLGTLGLPALIWQGDLPGLPPHDAMFVRDLGPEHNDGLVRRFPDRRPLVAVPAGTGTGAELLPYERGVELLWTAPAPDDETGGGGHATREETR